MKILVSSANWRWTVQSEPVKGVLPVALEARRRGKRALFVPEANAREAAMVDRIDIYGVQNLRQTFEFLRGGNPASADARVI